MKKSRVIISTDNPVTEKFLEEKLKSFATKVDLKTEIAFLNIELDEKLDRLDGKNRGYRDEILTRIDSFAKKIVDLEEDNEVGTFQIKELKEKTENHEKRLKTIEIAKN